MLGRSIIQGVEKFLVAAMLLATSVSLFLWVWIASCTRPRRSWDRWILLSVHVDHEIVDIFISLLCILILSHIPTLPNFLLYLLPLPMRLYTSSSFPLSQSSLLLAHAIINQKHWGSDHHFIITPSLIILQTQHGSSRQFKGWSCHSRCPS